MRLVEGHDMGDSNEERERYFRVGQIGLTQDLVPVGRTGT
jgi:hypothetical protein